MRRLTTAVVALMAGSVLAFGSVYPWAYWPLAAGCALVGLRAIWITRAWRDRSARTAIGLVASIALAIGVQLVPLPRATFVRLAPAADRFLANYDLRYVLEPPAWHALSVAPGHTVTVLLIFVAFAVLFVGLMEAMAHAKLDRVVVRVMWLGVALAVFGVLQRAVNVKSPDNDEWQLVYGFWKPQQAGNVFGPFINRNHYAGWMVMVVSLVMGYGCAVIEAARPAGRSWRHWLRWTMTPDASRFMAVAVAVLAMGAALVATGSRSGAVSMAAAIAVLGYFIAGRLGRPGARVAAIAALALLLAGAIATAGASQVAARFSLASSDLGMRAAAWRDTATIIRDFPVFGVGAGGYRLAVLDYQTGDRTKFYLQAHNDYLQIAAEGGLLVGLPVAVALMALGRGIRARLAKGDATGEARWIRVGAVAGLVGIGAQSLFEFSLQMPANLVVFVVLAAIAIHVPLRSASHARRV
jgi:O-antigen ligase